MFPSLVIISLPAFPPLDTRSQLQQFSPVHFCILIHYWIACQNFVIHKIPPKPICLYNYLYIHWLGKGLTKSIPQDIVWNLKAIAWNLHYSMIGFKSQLQIRNWIELPPFFNSTLILVEPLQRFALCKVCVDFESEIKLLPHEHDFSSISWWIALKLETPTYLKISDVTPCLFFHKILSKKFMSDIVDPNSWTQFCNNGSLLAIEMWVCHICTIYLGPQVLTLMFFTPQDVGDIKEPFQPPHPH